MPAATDKSQLLAVTAREFDKLDRLIEGIGPDSALVKDAGNTSIKDVVGHRAHWIDLFLGWHADGQAGKTPHFPAEGYDWGDLKAYNAMVRQRQAGLSWPAAVELLRSNHRKLTAFMESKSENELYGGPMKGGNNKWTTGRRAEAAGPSHYRSATKFIRARLKELA